MITWNPNFKYMTWKLPYHVAMCFGISQIFHIRVHVPVMLILIPMEINHWRLAWHVKLLLLLKGLLSIKEVLEIIYMSIVLIMLKSLQSSFRFDILWEEEVRGTGERFLSLFFFFLFFLSFSGDWVEWLWGRWVGGGGGLHCAHRQSFDWLVLGAFILRCYWRIIYWTLRNKFWLEILKGSFNKFF